MRIIVFNQYFNNRGDESAHKALIRSLRDNFPKAEIIVLYNKNKYEVAKPFMVEGTNVTYKALPNFRPGKIWRKMIKFTLIHNCIGLSLLHPAAKAFYKYMKSADYNICVPGGIDMGGFQDWSHLFLLHLAKYTNKPLAYYGRSIGPFPEVTKYNKYFKKLSEDILRYFSYLSLRDAKSCNLAKSMGINYISTVDTAFQDSPNVEVPEELSKEIGKDYLVFVPNLLIWHFAYKGKVNRNTVIKFYTDITKILLEKFTTSKIVMLPQTYGYKDDIFGNDEYFFHEIENAVNNNRIFVAKDSLCNSDIQQSIIRNAKVMVGARYHSVIFAINNCVPLVALSYEHKINGMLETINESDRMIDITNTFGNIESINECLHLFREKISLLDDMKNAQKVAKQIAEKGFLKLKQDIIKYQ